MGYLSCKAESSVSIMLSNIRHPQALKVEEFEFKQLETATNGFSEKNLLGKGSHGHVYKGILRGGHVVAIKKAISSEVDNEIEILSKLRSPYLVNLLGFTSNDDDGRASNCRLLVVEFMSNGTIYDSLHSNPRSLNWACRIRLCLQVAKGIDGLHCSNPPVVHRDIKSANVLIDHGFNARLGDFGLALRCGEGDDYNRRLQSTPPAGTMGYLDPFYVTPDNLSTKIDVFSFGILLLEIISGRKAIDVRYSPSSIVDWAIPLIRRGRMVDVFDRRIEPLKDPMVRKQLVVIAMKCVRSCREKRPSMEEIVEILEKLSGDSREIKQISPVSILEENRKALCDN